MIRGFIHQLQFMTTLPIPLKLKFDENEFARAVIFFPIIGLIIGLFTAASYYLLSLLEVKLIALALAILLEILLTGGLHLDGLADTFDGIFSYRPKERILEIMRDSRIGTNGTLSLILLLSLKLLLLYSIEDLDFVRLLIILPLLGRTAAVWSIGLFPYAREGRGMGAAIVNQSGIKEIIITTIIAAALISLVYSYHYIILIPALLLFSIPFSLYVKRKIGGITGDIIGALIELSEVAAIFCFFLAERLIVMGLVGGQ